MLSYSNDLLKLIAKQMKANFFMNMNDIIINKHDELKYFILMKENFRKYKLKTNYFFRWKKTATINENSINIKESDSLDNIRMNNNLFKSMNSFSSYPKLKNININNRSNSLLGYNDDNFIENNLDESKETKINMINIWKNYLKVCKNNNLYLKGNFNKFKILKIQNFNLNLKSFIIKSPLTNIDNNTENNQENSESNNLFENKIYKYNQLLKIIKNSEFKIVNYFQKNKKFELFENGLNKGQEYKSINSEINENNKEILRNKNKIIKTGDKNNNNILDCNETKTDNQLMVKVLLIIFLILIVSLIINEMNIDNF